MEKSFIYTENMTVGYDGKALIRDIRLSLEKGQIRVFLAFFLRKITKKCAQPWSWFMPGI